VAARSFTEAQRRFLTALPSLARSRRHEVAPTRRGIQESLKRISRRGYDRARLDLVVQTLREGHPLPVSTRSHPLKGEWKGHWECHIAPDWLLIYKLSENEVVLARTGTHSDLFKL